MLPRAGGVGGIAPPCMDGTDGEVREETLDGEKLGGPRGAEEATVDAGEFGH